MKSITLMLFCLMGMLQATEKAAEPAAPNPKQGELIPQIAGVVIDAPPFRFVTDVGDTEKDRRAFAQRILKPVLETTEYFLKVYGLRPRVFDDYAEHYSGNKFEKLIRFYVWNDRESFLENYQRRYASKSIPGAFFGTNADKDAYGKETGVGIREIGLSSEGVSNEQVLRYSYHEMGHLFMEAYMVVDVEVPSWIEEGTAELFQFRVGNGTKPEAERLQRTGWLMELLQDRQTVPWADFIKVRNIDNLDFTWQDPLRSTIQYMQAWAVVEFMIASPERADAYMKMIAEFKKRGTLYSQQLLTKGEKGDVYHDHMRAFLYTVQEDCVKKVYGSDLLKVEDSWKDWIGKNYEKELKKKPAVRYHRGEWQLMRAEYAKGPDRTRMLTRAEVLFNECQEKAPNDPEGWVGAGRLALERQQYDKAWDAFGTALSKGADNEEAQLYGGIGRVLRGDAAAAVDPLSKATLARPNSFEPNYWYGVALTASRGDLARAAQVFTIAANVDRSRAGQCSWWEGVANLLSGRIRQAKLSFMRALGESNSPPETIHWLAIAQASGGEVSDALSTLEKAEKDDLTELLHERFAAGKPPPGIVFGRGSRPQFDPSADFVPPPPPKDKDGKDKKKTPGKSK